MIDLLDVTCFIAQHDSDASTSIFRSLRLIMDLFHVLYLSGSMCVGVTVWFGWGGVVSLCRLKHYSRWSIFIQLLKLVYLYSTIKMTHGPINIRNIREQTVYV
jgi:hypothetical protein